MVRTSVCGTERAGSIPAVRSSECYIKIKLYVD